MKKIYLLFFLLVLFGSKISYSQCSYSQAIASPNLVTNGDFSLGNTGFTSGYTYYPTGNLLLESSYAITTDASSIHFAFTGVDHTSGTGNFMVLNGSGTPTFVWNKTVNVQANKYYNFSAWFRNIVTKPAYAGLPLATVELWINGVKISRNLLLDDYPDQWLLLDTSWFSGSATTANLSIKNIGVSLNGNDFAIDDIAFRICCGGGSKTNHTICKGSGIQLNSTGTGSFTWDQTTGLNNPSLQNPIASPDTTRRFIITFPNGGCPIIDTFLVTVINPNANAGLDKSICKRQSILLNGSGNGTGYSWLPIKNIVNNLSSTPTVNPDTTTTYILTVTNGSCIARDTVTVFVNPLDVNIINKDTVFCLGDTIYLNGTTNGFSFQWSPTINLYNSSTLSPNVIPTNDITYYLSASDAVCTVTDSVRLTLTNIQVDLGLDTMLCEGDSIQLWAVADPGCDFKWGPPTHLDHDDIMNPYFSPPRIHVSYGYGISVVVTKGNCKANDYIEIMSNAIPDVSAGPDKKICQDGFTTLDGWCFNAKSILWSPSVGINDVKSISTEVRTNTSAKYILLTENEGCFNSDTVEVIVNPKVVAQFSANPSIAIAPATIQFLNSSKNAYFFNWDFDDNGAQSNQKDPSYLYKNTGTYTVWLLAKDSLGCKDSMSLKIELTLDPYLHVPNVFTPDEDGINDSFALVYNPSAFEFLEYDIYNRWGQHLYYAKLPEGPWWDGTFEGKPCPGGVYFYIVRAKALIGKTYDLHGTVTLLK